MAHPHVFLSHAGIDSDEAKELKTRLLASHEASESGLKVWLDLDDLVPGKPWQDQISDAIGQATAGIVLVGSRGMANWVKPEFDLMNSKAIKDSSFRLIPVFIGDARSRSLTPFAKRYQGVRDPLESIDNFKRLLGALLDQDQNVGKLVLADDPFPGLRSMDETWSDRFFGRETEIDQVLQKLRHEPIVSIIADSGAGKSSLAMAGVGAAWRGGAFAQDRPASDNKDAWQTITMRPRSNPVLALREAISKAAGSSDLIDQSAEQMLYQLNAGSSSDHVKTLLIVDQAEELVTQTTSAEERKAFGALISDMVRLSTDYPDRLRVLITVRSDYANLVRGIEGLGDHIKRDEAYLRLAAPNKTDLEAMVSSPLRLAGFDDADQVKQLIEAVSNDLSDRAGDLALAQMALHLTWRERAAHNGNLLAAYTAIGRVFGALGQEAERVERSQLSADETELLMPVFVRLIRIGDTAGATRRTAELDEFSPEQKSLIDKLAGEECGRLLQTTETNVEISHEALITQWYRLYSYVQSNQSALRNFSRLMSDAKSWATSGRKTGRLAKYLDLEDYRPIRNSNHHWLSSRETQFLVFSKLKVNVVRSFSTIAFLAIATSAFTAWTYFNAATTTKTAAEGVQRLAIGNYARTISQTDPISALKLSLSAYPDHEPPNEFTKQTLLSATADALQEHIPIWISEHIASVLSVAFSPDGSRIVSGSFDGKLLVWDARTGRSIGEPFEGHRGSILSVAFSPDGSKIVSGASDTTLRLWDAQSGQPIRDPLEGHRGTIRSVAFSPDGTRLASGSDDGTLCLWDVETGKLLRDPLKGHQGSVRSVTFSPDGSKIVSGASDGTLRIWDARSGKLFGDPLQAHQGSILSVDFSSDGSKIVSGASGGTLRLWDAQTHAPIGDSLKGHQGFVLSVAFSPDGSKIVSGASDRTLRIWDARAGEQIGGPLEGHQGSVWSVAFNLDGTRIVSGASDRTLRIWDAQGGTSIGYPLQGSQESVRSVAFSPDGSKIVSGTRNGKLRIWDARKGTPIGGLIEGHRGTILSVAFSPDGSKIVSGSTDETLRLWDAQTGTPISYPFEGYRGTIHSFAFSPDGSRVVSGAGNGTLRIWDAQTGSPIGDPYEGHRGSIYSVAFSPDGTRIVSGASNGTLRLWDAQTGTLFGDQIQGHNGSVLSVAFSPDGSRIASGASDHSLRIWDVEKGSPIGPTLKGHRGAVFSVAFSPDGSRIVSGASDNTLRIWDVHTGFPIGDPLEGHQGRVLSVAFSPDGSRIVSGASDGTLRLWRSWDYSGNILQIACQKLPLINGVKDYSIKELAESISIGDPDPITPCEVYDPPL